MDKNTIVTVDDLAKAIRNSPNNRGMIEKEAQDLARHMLNFFGYSDRIIDNVLEPEDRDAFYMLEDAAILTTEREETTLYDGREWRIHYWLFRKDRIRNLMESINTYDEQVMSSNNAYNDLPSDIWDRSTQ